MLESYVFYLPFVSESQNWIDVSLGGNLMFFVFKSYILKHLNCTCLVVILFAALKLRMKKSILLK